MCFTKTKIKKEEEMEFRKQDLTQKGSKAGGQRLEGERLQKIIKKGLIIIGYI